MLVRRVPFQHEQMSVLRQVVYAHRRRFVARMSSGGATQVRPRSLSSTHDLRFTIQIVLVMGSNYIL